jgi:dTDP-4-amino-4,6-dideoxygalactose transaminase
MKIPYVDLTKQYKNERKEILSIIDNVFKTGQYVGGEEVKKFENNISSLLGVKHCIALNSGTDALTLGLHVLGVKKNDEVITTSNSFIASTAVIVHLGAKPVFIDVKPDQCINPELIEKSITKKTKAIMAVHLTGRVCDMDKILKISKKYNIPIIEDAAQSIGSKHGKKYAGTFGKIACFSAHPLKNLNALGDGGYLTTNSSKIAKFIKDVRNHGMTDRNKVTNFGYVSRMDNLQAAILNFRLKKINKIIKKRRENVKIYLKNLNQKFVFVPKEDKKEFNTYHTFVVQVKFRDELKRYLKKKGISTAIHYPIPIHLQPALKKYNHSFSDLSETVRQSKRIITLPIHQYLKNFEIKKICEEINNFYENK